MVKLVFGMFYWMLGALNKNSFLFQQLTVFRLNPPHHPDHKKEGRLGAHLARSTFLLRGESISLEFNTYS
jgi:hypothetical protein